MALLQGIAELHGIELASDVREEAAGQLAAALADPRVIEAALATCSSHAQGAWRALLASGGRMKLPIFARQYGAIRPVGPGRLEREQTWRQPQSAAEELWYRGLIYRAFADLGDGPAEYVFIPRQLLPTPAGDVPAQPATSVEFALPAVPGPERSRQAYNSLAVDLCTIMAALREAPARVDSRGQLRPTEEAQLGERLLSGDRTRLAMLLTLGREANLLATDRGRLVVNAEAATAWLRGTHWEQMSSLFAGWRRSTAWNDLRRVPSLRAEGNWHNDPILARQAVLGALQRLRPEAWYAVADLIAGIKATHPDFQRPDGIYTTWYLADVETGRYLSGFESWDEVEGRLIRFLVIGPLFWLGAVALSEEGGGHPQVFSLTRFGWAWLSDRTPAELPRPMRLQVSDDFLVTAPLGLPLLDRFRLLRFTDPVPRAGELGQPTRHKITRGSLARGRAAGVKGKAAGDFLRRASGGHLPARVEAALTKWDQIGGAVRLSRGAVLRVEDARILSALRGDPAIAPLLGDLISAQAVLVKEANLPALLKVLRESGYETTVE